MRTNDYAALPRELLAFRMASTKMPKKKIEVRCDDILLRRVQEMSARAPSYYLREASPPLSIASIFMLKLRYHKFLL